MIAVYITSVFVLMYSILILQFSRLWRKIPVYHAGETYKPSTAITVIVPARNEEKNIENCISNLLQQNYPRDLMQVIIIDDDSEDDTLKLAKSFSDSRLLILRSGENVTAQIPRSPGKKRAIATGIENSTGSLIITTDADCIAPVQWLRTIVAFYEEKMPVFIAAPVKYSIQNRFSGIFQALDFLSLQGITAAGVHHSMLMMSNGANLAYEKKTYYEVGGFSGIDELASGDDLFLMQKIANDNKGKLMYCLTPEAIVSTIPAGSWYSFLQQRLRWASKARSYSDGRITAVLALVYLLNFSLLILLIASTISFKLIFYWAALVLIKTGVELTFLYPVAKFFKQHSLLWYFFPSQPLHIIYTVVAGFFGQVKRYEWKGRKVK
jgi:cellulose synthase/poly-beta-1,6-N-acetylglucosamine synthase-like glycosyltransferase